MEVAEFKKTFDKTVAPPRDALEKNIDLAASAHEQSNAEVFDADQRRLDSPKKSVLPNQILKVKSLVSLQERRQLPIVPHFFDLWRRRSAFA
jgi:hypothetical protein